MHNLPSRDHSSGVSEACDKSDRQNISSAAVTDNSLISSPTTSTEKVIAATDAEILDRGDASLDKVIKDEIPADVQQVEVTRSHLECSNGSVPKVAKSYRIFKYRNPNTKRNVKIMKCDHDGCVKVFRKIHELRSHMASHTG